MAIASNLVDALLQHYGIDPEPGGTPFMKYLKQHEREMQEYLVH